MKYFWLAFLLPQLLLAQVSQKRGLGYGYHSAQDLQALGAGISWWYNWHHQPDAGVQSTWRQSGVAFMPMAWGGGYDRQALIYFLENHPETKYLLGFNEPNFTDQANLTPSQAAALWPELEAIADQFDLKIIGPAVNFCGDCVVENGTHYGDPVQYLNDFFTACTGCRVDYIAVHWYGCGGLEWYLSLFEKYKKPLWVTEIACWDNDQISLEQQKNYLIDVVELMENHPLVYKYAWFTGRGGGPNISLLGSSGQLNELGQLYVHMPVHDTTFYMPLPGKVEAENYQKATGIELAETTDIEGGLHVRGLGEGDWLEYQVEVENTGWFTFDVRLAAPLAAELHIRVDGIFEKSIAAPATGGWQIWKTNADSLWLEAGKHRIRVEMVEGSLLLNWLNMQTEREVILSISKPSDILVYPNPAIGHFYVQWPEALLEKYNVEIFDLSGRRLLHQSAVNLGTDMQIPVNLPGGTYILQISSSKTNHRQLLRIR